MAKLLIIEDHPLTAMIAEEIFTSMLDLTEIRYIDSPADLVNIDRLEYDIVLTDLMMPGVTPEYVLDVVNSMFAHARRFVFTALNSPAIVERVEAGGAVYLCKNTTFRQVLEKVHSCLMQGSCGLISERDRRPCQSLIQLPGRKPLTSKQAAIIALLSKGNSVKEAARIVSLSPETIKAHVREAFVRLDAHNGREASTKFQEARRLAERVYGKQAVELSMKE